MDPVFHRLTTSCFWNIDAHLSWEKNLINLAAQLSSKCFLIRSIRITVSINVLLIIYVEFYTHLLYIILHWGSSPHALNIFRIQKRTIRLIENEAPCRPLFKCLLVLPVSCVYIFTVLLFVKLNFCDFFLNSAIHNQGTRQCSGWHVPFVGTKKAICGFRTMSLRLCNKLPKDLKAPMSMMAFKNKIKNFIVQMLLLY
jgi:hypothetical protein